MKFIINIKILLNAYLSLINSKKNNLDFEIEPNLEIENTIILDDEGDRLYNFFLTELTKIILTAFDIEWSIKKINYEFATEELEIESRKKYEDFMGFYFNCLLFNTINLNCNLLINNFCNLIDEDEFSNNESRYTYLLSNDINVDELINLFTGDIENEKNRIVQLVREKTMYPIFFENTIDILIEKFLN